MKRLLTLLFAALPFSPIFSQTPGQVISPKEIQQFEAELEDLRQQYHLPSISVGVVHDKQLIWHKGFGFADIENKRVPDENTIYHIASVTKTFGSIILMQLVEQGKINLNDPVTKYGIKLGARWRNDSTIQIRHLLTHTAHGGAFNGYKPGYEFRYSGDFYGEIGMAIKKASGDSFTKLLVGNIIKPLNLINTAPTVDDSLSFSLTGYNRADYYNRLAKAYDWDHGKINAIKYPIAMNPAAGIMSSVSDLAKYSVAIDEGKFLSQNTWQEVFTPVKSLRGRTLRYGLGWFIGYHNGIKMIWHTGWWQGASALFLKIPERDLTFIILANSQDLSRPFYHRNPLKRSLGKTALGSDFAKTFWRYFIR